MSGDDIVVIGAMIANNHLAGNPEESTRADDTEGSAASVETVLRNDRRREVLDYLAAREGDVDLSSVALYLAASEGDPLSAVIGELHDHHLPKLAARDLLDYEDGTRVRLLIDPDHVEALVSRAENG